MRLAIRIIVLFVAAICIASLWRERRLGGHRGELKSRFDLDNSSWEHILACVKANEVAAEVLPAAIVRLGKTEDSRRLEKAKDVILSFLDHPDELVRHEAMWFTVWEKLEECVPKLKRLIFDDPHEDIRCYAVTCLGRMYRGQNEPSILLFLAQLAATSSNPDNLRVEAFDAVVSVKYGEAALNYLLRPDSREKATDEIDMSLLKAIITEISKDG